MTNKDAALKLAIEAIETCNTEEHTEWDDEDGYVPTPTKVWRKTYDSMKVQNALEACKSALEDETSSSDTAEMQESETSSQPVAWQFYQDGEWHNGMNKNNHKQNTIDGGFPVRELYLHSAKRIKRLSDDEIKEIKSSVGYTQFMSAGEYCNLVITAIMDAMEEKNTF